MECVLLALFTLLVSSSLPISQARVKSGQKSIKSAVFLSPKFVLVPGLVVDKYYYDIDFPRGHIAIKDFNAEVIDEAGNSVPLHETYLHHWTVARYYQRIGAHIPKNNKNSGFGVFTNSDNFILVKNSGLCETGPVHYFGIGSETRKTETHVPDPYGIEVGDPKKIPLGYEEKWLLNVHAIDTRGVHDRLGCTECRCGLYNVTKNRHGQGLDPGYVGGLQCCYDGVRCEVSEGFESVERRLYIRYTLKWVEFDSTVVPVRIYMLDVTDTWKKRAKHHHCLIEYEVESCSGTGRRSDNCIDTKRVALSIPKGGIVVYGAAHQHAGGIGSTLHGADGRVICSSIPTYGHGNEAGDEAGYIVGVSSCYPRPGSVTISDGETLVYESHYNSSQRHTGVMGLFYLLVADHASQNLNSSFPTPFEEKREKIKDPASL